MTSKFKELILKFLTGKMENESGDNDQHLQSITNIDRDIFSDFLPSSWDNFKIEGLLQMPENISDKIIIYGGFLTDNYTSTKGYICILDNQYNPIKMFTKFDNGTDLRYIQQMQCDEEGNIFAVDSLGFLNNYDLEKRFIMLNNFTIERNNIFSLILRKSYILPNANFYCRNIQKKPEESKYCLAGSMYNEGYGASASKVISLNINVGSEIEWQNWDTTSLGPYRTYGSIYVSWNEENVNFIILASSRTNIYLIKNNDDTLSEENIYTSSYNFYEIDSNASNTCVFQNENNVYFTLTNQGWANDWEKVVGLYKYDGTSIKEIYKNSFGVISGSIEYEQINIVENNGNIYIFNSKRIDDISFKLSMCRLINDELNLIDVRTITNKGTPCNNIVGISKKYNLLSYYYMNTNLNTSKWRNTLIKEIYNENNYNGLPYENRSSTIPNSVTLFDNNVLIFSRNLYNKSINNSTTISTVEIPNAYLNNNTITNQNLISKTNCKLIENIKNIKKNIYEKLYINFINTISVLNNNKINKIASNKLNFGISTEDEYDNTKMTKYRINYKEYNSNTYWNGDSTIYWNGNSGEIWEETTTIKDLPTPTIINNLATYIININTAQGINTIEFLSNDETTVYRTIDLSNYEKNKNLKITQEVEVI